MFDSLCHSETYNVDSVLNWTVRNDDIQWSSILDGWIENRETYLKYVKEKRLVVQAGGYSGLFPRLLSDIFSVVYTFEPDPLNFHCLVQNCQKGNIYKFNSFLSSSHGMAGVIDIPGMPGMNRINDYVVNTGPLKIRAGDTPKFLIDDLELPYCDLIMLDTEGHEPHILKGAENTLNKYKPVVIVEDGEINRVGEMLAPLGYKMVTTVPAGRDFIYSV